MNFPLSRLSSTPKNYCGVFVEWATAFYPIRGIRTFAQVAFQLRWISFS